MKNMEIEDYKKLLKSHDWYYEYSDDYGVWNRGSENYTYLRNISKQSDEHKALFLSFHP